jgi:predicted aldo/keto reductase-like oxidoreductase
MKTVFPEIKKKLGFGGMRFPKREKEIDLDTLSEMIDVFMENGFNYFDTAHGYHGGKSETALRECLVKRYPRESFVLTNKLSTFHFEKQEEIRPLFELELEACGVDYFDFYFMHAQSAKLYEKYTRTRAYETALELMKEGKFRHFGISFHDEAPLLDRILTEHPEIEVVQIQLNYLDFEDVAVQSRKCLEVCEKHGKAVMVMAPVKGGHLASPPEDVRAIFDELGNASYASYAIRFAANFESVAVVLSGMSTMDQVLDNVSYMKDFKPLEDHEIGAIKRATDAFLSKNMISCTACRYCTDGCPMSISIPDLFACYNSKKIFNDWNADFYYSGVHTVGKGKASDCIGCGACEIACPQKLPIRELLVTVKNEFEKPEEA